MKLKGRKITILGRPVSVFLATMLLLVVGIASAALLSYYGMVTGTATVEQSVLLDGNDYTTPVTYSYTGVAGDTVVEGPHWLTNNADVPATVKFDSTCHNSSDSYGYGTGQGCDGITTSYQLVTTAFAKGDASATWNDDGTVTLTVNEANTPAVVMVPVNIAVSDLGQTEDRFTVDVTSSEDEAYGQLMIDLDPSNTDSYWAQVYGSAGSYSLFIYESEGDFVWTGSGITADEVKNKLTEYGSNPTIVGVKAQVYKWVPEGETLVSYYGQSSFSDTVDSITFDGTTYELNKDDRTELDVTTFTMPPLPGEQFDFQITNNFVMNLMPDTYTIETEIVPVTG